MKKSALFSILLIGTAAGGIAQCLDEIGTWPHSSVSSGAVISSTHAAAVDGRSLRIIDYSQGGAPVVGALVLGGVGRQTRSDGGFLYIVTGFYNITQVDVSDPTAPSVISTWAPGDWVKGIAVEGGLGYVLESNLMSVVDFGSSGTPVVIGTLALPSGDDDAIDVVGDTAVVADFNLHVIDISDPNSPVDQGSVALTAAIFANSVKISGSKVYAAGYDGFSVVDISNPAAPVENGSLTTINGCSVEAYGTWVYTSRCAGVYGLQIIDASDPEAPVALPVVGSWPGSLHRLGERMSSASGELRVLDISVPDDPQEVASLPGWGLTYDVAITGTVALAASGAGVLAFDISDPSNPIEIGGLGTRVAFNISISGTLAAVGTYLDNGLQVLDINDPAAPVELGFVPLSEWPRDVAFAGDIAYVALLNTGFAIVDLSTPSAPVVLDTITWSNQTNAVAVQGDLLLVGKNDRLLIYDITTPTSPTLIWNDNSAYVSSWEIAIEDDLAYLVTSYGLTVLSIADPYNPVDLGHWTAGQQTTDVAVNPPLAYVSDLYVGVYAVDLQDPANPVDLGFWPTYDEAEAVAFSADHVLVADRAGGLTILDACGGLFADGFEAGDTSAWTAAVP